MGATTEEKKPERLLGEWAAHLPPAYRKEFEEIVTQLKGSEAQSILTSYVIERMKEVNDLNGIVELLRLAFKAGLLIVSATPPLEGPYFKSQDGVFAARNPMDRRAQAIIMAARSRNSELRKQ